MEPAAASTPKKIKPRRTARAVKQRAQLGLPRKAGTQFYRVPSYSVFYDILPRLDCETFAAHLNGWMVQNHDALPAANLPENSSGST